MKKMLVAVSAFLLLLGIAGAVVDVCSECWTNTIDQDDMQVIEHIKLAGDNNKNGPEEPVIFNEAETAAVTITPTWAIVADSMDATVGDPSVPPVENQSGYGYITAGFSKIDQKMVQTINTLENQKGLAANKATQAAWTENQGAKEYNKDTLEWDFEGSFIQQETVQDIINIKDWNDGGPYEQNDATAQAIFNADSKLAVIADSLNDLYKSVSVTSNSNNDQEAVGLYDNNLTVNADIAGESNDTEE